LTTITQANVHDDPVVEAFPLGSYDRKPQRTVTYEWLVREEGGAKIIVTLHTHHIKGRGYVANVSNRTVEGGVWSWAPMNDERVLVTPDPGRYSKGALERFSANALTTFRHRVEMGDFGEFLRGEKVAP
jgi:hypothetical protein